MPITKRKLLRKNHFTKMYTTEKQQRTKKETYILPHCYIYIYHSNAPSHPIRRLSFRQFLSFLLPCVVTPGPPLPPAASSISSSSSIIKNHVVRFSLEPTHPLSPLLAVEGKKRNLNPTKHISKQGGNHLVTS